MVKPRTKVAGIVAAVLMVVGSPIASVIASVQIAERNAERVVVEQAKQQRIAEEAARVEAKRITCDFFRSSMDVYLEAPPSTDAGEAQQANYAELYRITGCQPPRTK